jgi:predicted MFS family arabinose efflux permease
VFYLFRQPLMSLSVPMILEVTMNYVGEKNREMASAIQSAIWAGAAFFSAIIYGYLRELEIAYVNIFYISAGLYVLAVVFYKILLSDYEKKEKTGLL